MRLDKNLAQAPRHLGQLLQQEGRFSDALPQLKQAVELEPSNALFWEHLAEFHGEREEQAEAIRCWERVLALLPDRPSAHLGIGWHCKKTAVSSKPANTTAPLSKLQPNSAAARMNLGGLHEEWGQLPEAESCFRGRPAITGRFRASHAPAGHAARGKLPEADRAALKRLDWSDPLLGNVPRVRLCSASPMSSTPSGILPLPPIVCVRPTHWLSNYSRRAAIPACRSRSFVGGLARAFDRDFIRQRGRRWAAHASAVFVSVCRAPARR